MLFNSDLSFELAENSTVRWSLRNTPVNHYFYNLTNYFELRTPYYSFSQRRLFSSYKLELSNATSMKVAITPLQKFNEVFANIDDSQVTATQLYFTGSSDGGVRQPVVSKIVNGKLKPICDMQQFHHWVKTSEKAQQWMCPIITEQSFEYKDKLMVPQIRIFMINLAQNPVLSGFDKESLRNYALKAMDSLAAPFQ